ncbi:hypothetical protein LshimejAT787_0107280 [Lyophyllum shimeji]|uniref:Uncharacterized protein n=1 Tax=Lyophyllum shimeji TaxID=47721 RepID=A0A9P3PDZ2_LYOSH|nr:hypothetical protein LshimejAT787_0107280 [Lyophyllum shimeji]
MTPRISDETWPCIWSHVFEASAAPRPPITGKIEFDIDMRQARWYAAWMASSHRDYVEHLYSANPSIAPSVANGRGESRTTFDDVEDQDESRSTTPATRHVPRKLSLVDRYDMMSSRSGSRSASRTALSPPEHVQVTTQVLSPIFQEEEPKSARDALDSRVKSWRASAVLKPTPLAATGQTSLEPANMPNTLPIEDSLLDTPDEELNLADFSWSISSAGPSDYDSLSPMSCERLPSVHIAHRMEGSVCLTPSDCTSFGPSDYTLPSPGPSVPRLPSPDIAHRMYDDVPPTPLTATSWGAPLELPPSPFSSYRAPSIDLGERLVYSRPVTPSSATSWGPASWPCSPLSSEYGPPSIHLADRGNCSRPVTPSTATSWGAPLSYPPSPATPFRVRTPDVGDRGYEDSELERGWRHVPWGHLWPYVGDSSTSRLSQPMASAAHEHRPWQHSWPFMAHSSHLQHAPTRSLGQHAGIPWGLSWPYVALHDVSHASESGAPPSVPIPSVYPRLIIYQPVYHHFDLYPAVVLAKNGSPGYPSFDLHPPLRLDASPRMSPQLQPVVVKLHSCYPVFDLYPAIYPQCVYEIYPPVAVNDVPVILTNVAPRYPTFNLYPAVYPHVVPYPPVFGAHSSNKGLTQKTRGYPDFDLYSATAARQTGMKAKERSSGFPDFNLYPPVEHSGASDNDRAVALRAVLVTPNAGYPHFNLYPAVYPHFDLYPALDRSDDYATSGARLRAEYPYLILYPPVAAKPNASSVKLATYPVVDLYPAVYPAFNIYPRVETAPAENAFATRSGYPCFELYPPVSSESSKRPARKPMSMRASCSYPIFDLYPPVYPFLEIYPALPRTCKTPNTMGFGYPVFNLYPPSAASFDSPPNLVEYVEYPTFNPYPAIASKTSDADEAEKARAINVKVEARYPAFDLYPAVYPYFNLWPAVDQPRMVPRPSKPSSRSKPSRLTHSELHAMVMMERIGKIGSFGFFESSSHPPSRLVKSHDDLHHAVFPDGVVVTPSGTLGSRYPEVDLRNMSFSDELLARRSLPTSQPSTRLPPSIASGPIRHLPPPPPSHDAHLSSAFGLIPRHDFDDDVPPTGVSTRKRALISRFPQDVEPHQSPGLTRASSLKNSSSLLPEVSDKLGRSNSLSATPKLPPPRKRDSLVSQRVRAYNSSQDGIQLSMETLSKFPAPPMPPVPRAPMPKRLDTSKYPFMR